MMTTSDPGTNSANLPAFTRLVDLAQERAGGAVLYASDDFFAEKENLIKPGRGVFLPDKYTDHGKWMDGWESRRKRTPGHDFCVVRLGLPGIIRGFDVDTNHFLGNFPEHASIEGCEAPPETTPETLLAATTRWTELLPIARLLGGSRNLFPVDDPRRYTHLRLHIYPDGGVARLRVHGEVVADFSRLRPGALVDLAAIQHGGFVALANDTFFGPQDHLILPGRSLHMGDGWETRRKRGPGHDWVIVRLGAPGFVKRIEVDTHHFKGNYPDRCSIDGAVIPAGTPSDFLASRSIEWRELLSPSKLHADTQHLFESELVGGGPCTHVRLNIYPDGGVARLRVHCQLSI